MTTYDVKLSTAPGNKPRVCAIHHVRSRQTNDNKRSFADNADDTAL